MSVAERYAVARHLDGDLITVAGFITLQERRELLAWAFAMEPHLRDNGPGRRVRRIDYLPNVPDIHRRIRMRLQAFMGVPADATPEPTIGWYVSIISAGGMVHPHRDAAPDGFRHLRCNLFLQTSAEAGRPVVADRPIDVEDRMFLAFFPSERLHSSEPALGDRPRVICSFGYLQPANYRLPA